MYRLRVHGKIARVDGLAMVVHAPHHERGHADPVTVEVTLADHLRKAAQDLAEGDPVWLDGNGWQRRDDDGDLIACIHATSLTRPSPGLTVGRASMHATVHGRIHTAVLHETIEGGQRDGDDVVTFGMHIAAPEMDLGVHVVLRVRMINGEASWVAANHTMGDRICLSGSLYELRWTDRDGVPRRAHELVADEWWWGKEKRREPVTVQSKRVPSDPIAGGPVVIRRRRGGA